MDDLSKLAGDPGGAGSASGASGAPAFDPAALAGLQGAIQQEGGLPFGWNPSLSVPTILYAGLLALASAVVIGVVPALKATHGAVQPRLSELSTGTISRLRFGGVWTMIIVAQVAFSVAFLPLAVTQADVVFALFRGNQAVDTSFPASEYVTAQLGRDAIVPNSVDNLQMTRDGKGLARVDALVCIDGEGVPAEVVLQKPSSYLDFDLRVAASIYAWRYQARGMPICGNVRVEYHVDYPMQPTSL